MKPVFPLLILLLGSPAGAKTIKLTVVHTNDVHGWILPRPDRKTGRQVGGAAALAAFVKAERAKGPVLLLDAGDWWQGTPEGSLSKGRAVAEVFDAIGYDATVPGNHEYDGGEELLKAIIAGMKTPVVGSNIAVAATGAPAPYVRPFLIKEVAGIRVGVFGLITSQMRRLSFPQNVVGIAFQPEADAAKKAVAALKAQGAEVVVMLSHVGQDDAKFPGIVGDQGVARAVPGIDLIIGGHKHFALDPALHEGATLIVNTGCYLDKAGRAVLEFDDQTRRVTSSMDSLHPLWIDEVGEDVEIKALVEKWRRDVGAALDVVIATAAVALTKARDTDSPMGNWMTDCIRKWTKTDLAFQNSGGIRTEFSAGPIRLRTIFELMPFDNRVTTLYIKGAGLKELFEHSVGRAPGALQLSGGSVSYDPAAPLGSRVRGVEIQGRALEPEAVYSIAAADFIVQGGDGFDAFAAGTDRADHDTLIRDVLGWCATREGTLQTPVGGRLKRL